VLSRRSADLMFPPTTALQPVYAVSNGPKHACARLAG